MINAALEAPSRPFSFFGRSVLLMLSGRLARRGDVLESHGTVRLDNGVQLADEQLVAHLEQHEKKHRSGISRSPGPGIRV